MRSLADLTGLEQNSDCFTHSIVPPAHSILLTNLISFKRIFQVSPTLNQLCEQQTHSLVDLIGLEPKIPIVLTLNRSSLGEQYIHSLTDRTDLEQTF